MNKKENPGPPKVVCCQCGNTVFKASTRYVGNGQRACKAHDGVVDQAEQIRQAELQIIEKRHTDREKRKHSKQMTPFDHLVSPKAACCCICENVGVPISDIFLEQVIIARQLELQGCIKSCGLDGFLVEINTQLEKFVNNQRVLLPYKQGSIDNQTWQRILAAVLPGWRGVIDLMQVAVICDDCSRRLKFPEVWRNWVETDVPTSPDRLETFLMLGQVAKDFADKTISQRRLSEIQNN